MGLRRNDEKRINQSVRLICYQFIKILKLGSFADLLLRFCGKKTLYQFQFACS